MLHAPRLPTVLALFALVGRQSERSAMEIVCHVAISSETLSDFLVDGLGLTHGPSAAESSERR